LIELSGTAPANDDPRNTPSYRAARAVAIGLGILMVGMLLVVVATLVGRIFGHSTNATSRASSIDQLPAGSRIIDVKADSGHVILRIRTNQGEEIRIMDDASGRVVSRLIAPK
jgi:hypothetical protein